MCQDLVQVDECPKWPGQQQGGGGRNRARSARKLNFLQKQHLSTRGEREIRAESGRKKILHLRQKSLLHPGKKSRNVPESSNQPVQGSREVLQCPK